MRAAFIIRFDNFGVSIPVPETISSETIINTLFILFTIPDQI